MTEQKINNVLNAQQVEHYQHEGYVVLRNQIDEMELQRFDAALKRHPMMDYSGKTTHPEPGRYTLSESCLADPDLAFMAEHPAIVPVVEQLLEDDVFLTAFVVYDRTPGGPGIPAHHDYKRWRPVGSSMNWLFTIVPLSDFDKKSGPLYISPRSHRLDRISDTGELALQVAPAVKPHPDSFIDPELKRGDLLLMNMHLWHKADPNQSEHHRVGIFNKYAAVSAPPATGYYLFNEGVYDAMSESGKRLIAVHSDKPIRTARLVLERISKEGKQYLFVKEGDGISFPGGLVEPELAIPDWDLGNYIASLHKHMRDKVHIETPWVTYVGDFEERDGLSRMYAYQLNENGFPVAYEPQGQWLSLDQAKETSLSFGYEITAIERWLSPNMIRGKGLSQAQSRIDQFAY